MINFLENFIFPLLATISYYFNRLLNCGFCKESIVIQKSKVLINQDCRCQQIFSPDNIKMILYTIVKNNCYFYVFLKDEDIYMVNKKILKNGIKYKCNELKKIMEQASIVNLPIVPSIYPSQFAHDLNYTIHDQAFVYKKALLHIVNANSNKLTIGEGYYLWQLKELSYNKLFEMLKSYMDYYEKIEMENNKKIDFIVDILGKSFTLNRGYGLYPKYNNEIIIDEIFYSFNEEEIKTKIIELFKKYSR
jgi:hypothetical protein